MSHYSVAVFTRSSNDSVDELLAPYDENIEVDRYVKYTKEQLIKKEKEEIEKYRTSVYSEYLKDPEAYLNDKCGGDPKCGHFKYVSQDFPEKLLWSDKQIYKNAIRDYDEEDVGENGEVYSQYNPKSKWDWYAIGGRFSNRLLLKSSNGKQWADEAYVSDVDFAKMKQLNLKNITPYEEFLSNERFYKPEYLKQLYPDEATYLMKESEFSTYAVVTPDGEWYSVGDMGWFGCSSETPDESIQWCKSYYENFIDPAIQNGWYMTIVDCHI